VIRAKGEDDPFHPGHENKPAARPQQEKRPAVPPAPERKLLAGAGEAKQQEARKLLDRADAHFKKGRYSQARLLYEEAAGKDKRSAEKHNKQWAYCKLHLVVERLNGSEGVRDWDALEREVRRALAMAPGLDKTGKWLLGEIRTRRKGGGAEREEAPAVSVRHLPRKTAGWSVAETANFRIFHKQSKSRVEKVARVAEATRRAMSRKWFGKVGPDWNPKCDLYLHADGKEYQHFTGVAASSPGHSRIESEAGRVVGRRIDLRCDNPNLLRAVLPHETTHVVLAGRFGKFQVPRWADEGMAVLTEPADKLKLHRKNLERCRRDGELFPVRKLMLLDEYPPARRVGAFYAQSVSLVDFLAKKGGPVTFSRFLKDALLDGYAPALRKHYHFNNFDGLQTAWSRQAFGPPTKSGGEITRRER
jgi:hypothetical protein